MANQAVILAAGFGSRLARHERDTPKPLREVGGLALIKRNLHLLQASGVQETVVVLGYRGKELESEIRYDAQLENMRLSFSHNPDYSLSNGLSVLAARPRIDGDFLLLMADHLFDLQIFRGVAGHAAPERGATLCVDYKVDAVFDIDDATKVQAVDGRVHRISKQLDEYNCIDTGLFLCSSTLFDSLEAARRRNGGDCSLSHGIAQLSRSRRMFVQDIGEALWQDVDTEHALRHAERLLQRGLLSDIPVSSTPMAPSAVAATAA